MSKARRLARGNPPTPAIDFKEPGTTSPPAAGTLEQLAFRSARYDDLLRDLRTLATRDDGWLRLIPDTDKQQVYLKWKFTRGPWERHYVWAAVEDMQVHMGLALLIRKLYEVDMHQRKPTLDKLYGQDEED